MILRDAVLLVAPLLAATLSGCGLGEVWRQRTAEAPAQTAAEDGLPADAHRIAPGHSMDPPPEVFNRNYDPYGTGQARSGRFAPPPVPPARTGVAVPDPQQDLRAEDGTAADRPLIRTLKAPRIFSSEGVRGLYDRMRDDQSRGSEDEAVETARPRPEGPIAMRMNRPDQTQARRFTPSDMPGNPVDLGLPGAGIPVSPVAWPVSRQSAPGNEGNEQAGADRKPIIQQAWPSLYKRPLFAEPAE